jgi:thiosulfate reductase cytochrome b subunit
MLYRYPQRHGVEALNVDSLQTIAVLHTIGAFLLIAFLVAHLYLITTGETVLGNLRAMLTGYEELHDDHDTTTTTATTEHGAAS